MHNLQSIFIWKFLSWLNTYLPHYSFSIVSYKDINKFNGSSTDFRDILIYNTIYMIFMHDNVPDVIKCKIKKWINITFPWRKVKIA